MEIPELIHSTGEWLRGDGPHSDIVISSRIRLARNLAHHRFSVTMSPEERREVMQTVRDALASIPSGSHLHWIDLEETPPLHRKVLVERHLISREHDEADHARGVAIDSLEMISVMVNEEDHLRIQSLRSGLRLHEGFEILNRLDDELSEAIDYAFDEELGYLTACPTNLGTGLRVSVMLHLPALVMTRHIEKAFRAVHDLRLAVRGLYGEGTEAYGEFYQISNQITLGRSEEELINDLQAIIEGLIQYERKARETLLKSQPAKFQDRIWRAYATLRYARVMSSEEAMRLLSAVRMGTHLQILPGLDLQTLNSVFLISQPAHLQLSAGCELPPEERDVVRARMLRERLAVAEERGHSS